jgi:hypothetical protein
MFVARNQSELYQLLIPPVRPPMGDCGGQSPYPPHPLWQAAVDPAGRQKVLSAAAEEVY